MKTKIIYISGNEIFDINDIRAAFSEVRDALNMDKTTVLFGVPVDADDSGIISEPCKSEKTEEITDKAQEIQETIETNIENIPIDTEIHIENIEPAQEKVVETTEPQVKKRGRPRKETIENNIIEEPDVDKPIAEEQIIEEPVVPILSVLSTKDEPVEEESKVSENVKEDIDIISEITTDDNVEVVTGIVDTPETNNAEEQDEENAESEEADLEKLLSAMTPLQEDTLEENIVPAITEVAEEDNSVDATLEQLATEFAETQDKIVSENKSSTRSKIGKLRNILPFKQSKHKDQELGDLFGWAGIAANDEDFSVPGFFTNAASKK